MKKAAKPKIEIRCDGNEWRCARVYEIHASGWASYTLADGTFGLAQPKNWRYVDQPEPEEQKP